MITANSFALKCSVFILGLIANIHGQSTGNIEFPCKDSVIVMSQIKSKFTLRIKDSSCEIVVEKPNPALFWFSTVRLNSINGLSIGAGIANPNDYTGGMISGISISRTGLKLDGGYVFHTGFDGPKPVEYSHFLFPFIAGAVKASIIQRWSIPTLNHEMIFGRGSEYSYFGYSGTIHFLSATFELGQYHPFSRGSKYVVASYGVGF